MKITKGGLGNALRVLCLFNYHRVVFYIEICLFIVVNTQTHVLLTSFFLIVKTSTSSCVLFANHNLVLQELVFFQPTLSVCMCANVRGGWVVRVSGRKPLIQVLSGPNPA